MLVKSQLRTNIYQRPTSKKSHPFHPIGCTKITILHHVNHHFSWFQPPFVMVKPTIFQWWNHHHFSGWNLAFSIAQQEFSDDSTSIFGELPLDFARLFHRVFHRVFHRGLPSFGLHQAPQGGEGFGGGGRLAHGNHQGASWKIIRWEKKSHGGFLTMN